MGSVNVQEIIARIGTGFTAIEKRILKVLPGWKEWPRRLRKVYILLGTYGSNDNALREMCEEFGWDPFKLKEEIVACQDFFEEFKAYRERGTYPEILQSKRKSRVTTAQLNTLYAQEAAMIQFMHLEDSKAQGRAGMDFSVRLVTEAGLLDIVESVAKRPEIKYYMEGMQKEPGVVHEAVADTQSEDGLTSLS
tara:strand:+ start:766 stop:1344 length:579 start_codon:yes stop_codon:yes gene_type:complete